jgi:hypothetical protein
MTGTAPGQPPRDLAARLFRALYSGFEPRTVAGEYVAVPMGTPLYAGLSPADIACQIGAASPPAPDPAHRDQPGAGT